MAQCWRWRLSRRQYSHSGDHTLQATDRAIKDVLRKAGDEYYVFVVSDADLGRYGIAPAAWNKILMQATFSFLHVGRLLTKVHD